MIPLVNWLTHRKSVVIHPPTHDDMGLFGKLPNEIFLEILGQTDLLTLHNMLRVNKSFYFKINEKINKILKSILLEKVKKLEKTIPLDTPLDRKNIKKKVLQLFDFLLKEIPFDSVKKALFLAIDRLEEGKARQFAKEIDSLQMTRNSLRAFLKAIFPHLNGEEKTILIHTLFRRWNELAGRTRNIFIDLISEIPFLSKKDKEALKPALIQLANQIDKELRTRKKLSYADGALTLEPPGVKGKERDFARRIKLFSLLAIAILRIDKTNSEKFLKRGFAIYTKFVNLDSENRLASGILLSITSQAFDQKRGLELLRKIWDEKSQSRTYLFPFHDPQGNLKREAKTLGLLSLALIDLDLFDSIQVLETLIRGCSSPNALNSLKKFSCIEFGTQFLEEWFTHLIDTDIFLPESLQNSFIKKLKALPRKTFLSHILLGKAIKKIGDEKEAHRVITQAIPFLSQAKTIRKQIAWTKELANLL